MEACVGGFGGMASPAVERGGRGFRVARHPLAQAAVRDFHSGDQEGTLRFFEAVLPQCRQMVDFGAHVGLTTLFAARWDLKVFAFEPNPTSHELLARNVAENPELASRIRLFRHGLGDGDGCMPLYSTATADPGATLFRDIERETAISAKKEEVVPMRHAASVLQELDVDRQTLLQMDIEGAEYLVLPAIAALLAKHKPWLHVAFHPFNLVAGADAYRDALLRLRCSLQAAEALAAYRYVHAFSNDEGWSTIEPEDRMDFLRHYLLTPKPVPRIATPQYGFVGALAFSDDPLPAEAVRSHALT
jgi:FkbM family methyltransferase